MGFVQVYESDVFGTNLPPVYPVYYTDEKYDATNFAIALGTLKAISPAMGSRHPLFLEVKRSTMWEIERISLIKKRCHEHDDEWRMIWPNPPQERPRICMKPSYIVLGLKMPEDDRHRVISAALAAQIKSIREMYIDSEDNLSMREVDYNSDQLL